MNALQLSLEEDDEDTSDSLDFDNACLMLVEGSDSGCESGSGGWLSTTSKSRDAEMMSVQRQANDEDSEVSELSLRITSYYSISGQSTKIAMNSASSSATETKSGSDENTSVMLTQQPGSQTSSVSPKQSHQKAILERLTENRDYCVLCPYKAFTKYKTRGALKFHLRIKHSKELFEDMPNKNPASPPPLVASDFNPPSTTNGHKNEDFAISEEDEEWTLSLDPEDDESTPPPQPQTKASPKSPKLFQRGLITEMIRESLPKLDTIMPEEQKQAATKDESVNEKKHLPIKPVPVKLPNLSELQKRLMAYPIPPLVQLKKSAFEKIRPSEPKQSLMVEHTTPILERRLSQPLVEKPPSDAEKSSFKARDQSPQEKQKAAVEPSKPVERSGEKNDEVQIVGGVTKISQNNLSNVATFKSSAAKFIYQEMLKGRPKLAPKPPEPLVNLVVCPFCNHPSFGHQAYMEHLQSTHFNPQLMAKQNDRDKLLPLTRVKIPTPKAGPRRNSHSPTGKIFAYTSYDPLEASPNDPPPRVQPPSLMKRPLLPKLPRKLSDEVSLSPVEPQDQESSRRHIPVQLNPRQPQPRPHQLTSQRYPTHIDRRLNFEQQHCKQQQQVRFQQALNNRDLSWKPIEQDQRIHAKNVASSTTTTLVNYQQQAISRENRSHQSITPVVSSSSTNNNSVIEKVIHSFMNNKPEAQTPEQSMAGKPFIPLHYLNKYYKPQNDLSAKANQIQQQAATKGPSKPSSAVAQDKETRPPQQTDNGKKTMPQLMPINKISDTSMPKPSSSNKPMSSLRLIRPWENGTKSIAPAQTSQKDPVEYVPLKKRRLIMYELDTKYS